MTRIKHSPQKQKKGLRVLSGFRSALLRDYRCHVIAVPKGGFPHSGWLWPLQSRHLQRRASFLFPGRFMGCSLNRHSGVLTSFFKNFNTCFAHVLICTNSLSLLKDRSCTMSQQVLKAFLPVGHRRCSELWEAVFISATGPGFPVFQAG